MNEHDEIARRLRDEGQAQAPPDLLPAVMDQVRQEPRRAAPRFALRRPVLLAGVAAVAAVAAVTFGLTHGPSGGGQASLVPARSEAVEGPAAPNSKQVVVAKVSDAQARRVLGPLYRPAVDGVVVAHVPSGQLFAYRQRLRAAAARAPATNSAALSASRPVKVRLVPLP